MRPAASAGGVRDVRDALRRTTALHFPACCLGWCGLGVPAQPRAVNAATSSSHHQVRVLLLEHGAVAREDGLRDRHERERRLDVAAGLDPAPRDSHRDVLLALEVLVGRLGGHGHLDARLPVDVVGPLPVEVALLALASGADVDHQVDVLEVVAHRDVGVAQLRAHGRIVVHHPEDAVHHRLELLGRVELDAHAGYELEEEPPAAGFAAALAREAAGLERAADFAAVERLARFVAVERPDDDARFDAAERPDDAGFDVVDRLDEEARFDAVERPDEEARFDEDARFAVERPGDDAGFDAVERPDDDARFDAAVERRLDDLRAVAAGFFAAELLAAVVDDEAARGPSSAETRPASPSTSRRRLLISSTTRSSSTSRMRLTAPASSPANSCAGPRSDWALSAVAVKVRSTAERTASTASTAPAEALSFLPSFFFFESFFAITARS